MSPISPEKRQAFGKYFREFLSKYIPSDAGQHHLHVYDQGRAQAKKNFEEILSAEAKHEDITVLVLDKLLPHADNDTTRARGAWVWIAPAISADVRIWFENSGWVKRKNWPDVARAILTFVRACTQDPRNLDKAVKQFTASGYAKGFQAGFLSPILNALRPEDFTLINATSLRVINQLLDKDFTSKLIGYPELNIATRELVKDLEPEMAAAGSPFVRPADAFDACTAYISLDLGNRGGETSAAVSQDPEYWKIAPGDNARLWSEWKKSGIATIGWEEFGDVSAMDRAQFDKKAEELRKTHPDWTPNGVNQVWAFSRIREGSKIVANRGTSEVLGIGTVIGPYEFAPGVEYGHHLPVRWDSLIVRPVDKPGWRRTLVKLDAQEFSALLGPKRDLALADPGGEATAFSAATFDLLAGLELNPTLDYYHRRRGEFSNEVEQRVQSLILEVAAQISPEIKARMETQNRLFSKIQKNDWGRGGAWPFYWGALYPKGEKRIASAQLFLFLHSNHYQYGFYVGEHGSGPTERLERNIQTHRIVLEQILKKLWDGLPLQYGGDDSSSGADNVGNWLKDTKNLGYRIATTIPREGAVKELRTNVVQKVLDTFERLYPLVLLSILDDPMPTINEYVSLQGGGAPEIAQEYTARQLADETSFPVDLVQDWTRAIERKGQAILYGPPGSGKTFVAERLARHLIGGDDGFTDLVQFHPSYSYEEFIQGLRPRGRPDGGGLDFPLVDGAFLEFCKRARTCKGRCVLVIDEINRANLAKVFGELMYLLEYRDKDIRLASGQPFSIPGNVRILGTMNTADRSIALVDFALRRRFAFIAVQPQYDILLSYHKETGFPAVKLIAILKDLAKDIGNPHFEVGISYFLRQDLPEQFENIWTTEIVPYIEEYFFSQPEKLARYRWENLKNQFE